MESALLRDPESIREFFFNFGKLCKNPIDINYFLCADTVRAFYKNGRMVGGYIINARGPLRYYQMMPESVRTRPDVQRYLARGNASEITCFWLIRHALTAHERNRIYLFSAVDALRSGKRWIFGGSVSPKAARTQKRVMPHVIYRGPWDFEGSPAQAQIYCSNWWELLGLITVAYSWTTVTDAMRGCGQALRRGRRRYAGALREAIAVRLSVRRTPSWHVYTQE
ncbi:hypothetical protein [Aquisalimonas asiatica]|uniref:Uncharacterized protein n=1 Tax=Aquisalimonas asiatica TaxID=406100 RepID=A0A1H8SWB0_9GAMM|nr:hypothetical protein [Aquisalimonas asiatica]SEO82483.1 hypothetical protein SAMN04488052_103219 [Aquisalimonas asiatica]